MSSIEDSFKNLETAIAELKAALQAEQIITAPESVSNQAEKTIEELSAELSLRF